MKNRQLAILVFEDGFIQSGCVYGASGRALGEAVFATAMTGYQETLTDPSYHRQIVIQTAPHIGNTGVNDEDPESSQIWVAGYVVRDPARRSSNWRSKRELEEELCAQGIVGICQVDTRAITRHLRDCGAMRAGIFSGEALPAGAQHLEQSVRDLLVDLVRQTPQMHGASLAEEVTTTSTYIVEPSGNFAGKPPLAVVAAIDLGIKSRTPWQMAERGIRVHVMPQSTTLAQLEQLAPDGIFFSNGPGDPEAATHEITLLRAILDRKWPFFGICLGNQMLGRALGYGTYKLDYGHRGVNQPVLDRVSGKVEITAHNHGFALDVPTDKESIAPFDGHRYGRVRVSHICLNDGVVEGLECLDLPAFSVQYHPEAAAGPHDAQHLFDRFLALMLKHRKGSEDAS